MKFFKKYQDYMKDQEQGRPWLRFKKLKNILKHCRTPPQQHCAVCDGTFFPPLIEDVSAVVDCFNNRAQKLVSLHLGSGFNKYFTWFHGKKNHLTLLQQGKDLVIYALINVFAFRKMLKKYEKFCDAKQGQAFKSQVEKMRFEMLRSPWLYELMALIINLRETKVDSPTSRALYDGFSLTFDNGKPSLSYELFDSVKIDIDLTCPICLDTVFDPVALTCGHIYCYMCACSATSANIVDGLKVAKPEQKCPQCREAKVYEDAVHLNELSVLLRRSCPEYWEQRLQAERAERVQQAKKYWESQCQAFMGL